MLAGAVEVLLALLNKDELVTLNPVLLQMVNEAASLVRKRARSRSVSPAVAKQGRFDEHHIDEDRAAEVPDSAPRPPASPLRVQLVPPRSPLCVTDLGIEDFAKTLSAERESLLSLDEYLLSSLEPEEVCIFVLIFLKIITMIKSIISGK